MGVVGKDDGCHSTSGYKCLDRPFDSHMWRKCVCIYHHS